MAALGVVLMGVGVYLMYESYKDNPHPIQKAKAAATGAAPKGG